MNQPKRPYLSVLENPNILKFIHLFLFFTTNYVLPEIVFVFSFNSYVS